ncbi:putative transmembrane protein [Toxoplasma gondii FOU]|uniref:Putative transmembrane protein n=1 Tax=Toxoplasma gondii FOU TaxID=943167 RepID=A0A086K4L4_TOXGO|nr:putative transmembrane protein [Toxoplasma gondii FOU]
MPWLFTAFPCFSSFPCSCGDGGVNRLPVRRSAHRRSREVILFFFPCIVSLASLVTYSTLTRRSLAFPHVLLAEAGSQAQQFAAGTFGLQAWEVAGDIFAIGGLRVGGDASTTVSSWRHAESADDSSSCSSLEDECLKGAAARIRDATQSRHRQTPSLIRIDACDYLSSYEADLQRLQRLRLLHAEAGGNIAVPELYDLSPHESSEDEENAGDEDRQSWRVFREEDTEDETDSPRAPRLSSEAGKGCLSLGVCTPHGAVGDTGRGSGDVTPVSRSPRGVSCGKGDFSGPSFGGDGSPWASSAGRLSSASALSSPAVSPESCSRRTASRSPATPRDGDSRAQGESPVSSPRAPRPAAGVGLHAELTEERMQVDPAASLRESLSTPDRRSSSARGSEGLVSSLSQSRSSPESPRCVGSARGGRDSGVSAPSSPASSRSGASAGAPGWSPRHAQNRPSTGRDSGDSGDRRSVGSSWTGSPTPRSPARGNAHVFSDQAVSPPFVLPPPRPPRPRRAAAQQALDSFRSLPDRPDRRGGNGDAPQSPSPEGQGQGQAEGRGEGPLRGDVGEHQAKKPRVDTQAACQEDE